MGFQLEIDTIREAHEMGLLTTPYAFDTKAEELNYVVGIINAAGIPTVRVDVSSQPHTDKSGGPGGADVSNIEVAACHPENRDFLSKSDDRGTAVTLMSEALGAFLAGREDIDGVMSADEDRMGASVRRGIPYIGSVGALDMVNFAAFDTVPEKYRGRNLYKHNANVTLMRSTVEENRTMGRWIGERLNRMRARVR